MYFTKAEVVSAIGTALVRIESEIGKAVEKHEKAVEIHQQQCEEVAKKIKSLAGDLLATPFANHKELARVSSKFRENAQGLTFPRYPLDSGRQGLFNTREDLLSLQGIFESRDEGTVFMDKELRDLGIYWIFSAR